MREEDDDRDLDEKLKRAELTRQKVETVKIVIEGAVLLSAFAALMTGGAAKREAEQTRVELLKISAKIEKEQKKTNERLDVITPNFEEMAKREGNREK